MAGLITHSRDRPLKALRHFRARKLAVYCLGEVVYIDVNNLTANQRSQLCRLLKIARDGLPKPA